MTDVYTTPLLTAREAARYLKMPESTVDTGSLTLPGYRWFTRSPLSLPEVISEYLTYISWDSAGSPARLRLPQFPSEAEVIIDPRFGWGAPVLAKSKVPVEAMVSLWRTGEPIIAVAEEYGLPADVVENVLRQAA